MKKRKIDFLWSEFGWDFCAALVTLDIIQGRKQVDLLLNLVVSLSRCYCWVEFAGCPSPTRCGGVTLPLSVVRWHAVGSPLQWPVSRQPASIAVGGDDAINNRSASSFLSSAKTTRQNHGHTTASAPTTRYLRLSFSLQEHCIDGDSRSPTLDDRLNEKLCVFHCLCPPAEMQPVTISTFAWFTCLLL